MVGIHENPYNEGHKWLKKILKKLIPGQPQTISHLNDGRMEISDQIKCPFCEDQVKLQVREKPSSRATLLNVSGSHYEVFMENGTKALLSYSTELSQDKITHSYTMESFTMPNNFFNNRRKK